MNIPPSYRRNWFKLWGAPRSSGFVLITVLLILSVTVVFVVVTSVLTQVERRAAGNASRTESARQNALFALDVALAQLQKEAGPDQRITARAEILDSNAATATIDDVKQPYWTGVWKTGNATLDGSGSSQRKTSLGASEPKPSDISKSAVWLVSTPHDSGTLATLDPIAGIDSSLPKATVAKVINSSSTLSIEVPLVTMNTTLSDNTTRTSGRYGYWISDEGVKAKVNLIDPTLASTDAGTNQYHFFAPQANAAHKIFPNSDPLYQEFRNKSALSKVHSLESLQMIADKTPTGDFTQTYSPDLTVHSRGVLADVRNGGLKKDLTAAFEDLGATQKKNYAALNPDGNTLVYSSTTDTDPIVNSGQDYSGMYWQSLYSYYNLYKGLMPQVKQGPTPNQSWVTRSQGVGKGVGKPEETLPYSLTPRGLGWRVGSTNHFLDRIAPICLAYRIEIALSSYPVGSRWRFRIHYYPQLVLYNPYSVTLRGDFQYCRAMDPFWSKDSTTNCTISSTVGNVTTSTTFAINQALYQGTAGRMRLVTKSSDSQNFAPGEIRVYGLENDRLMSNITSACEFLGSTTTGGLSSNGNYNPSASQYAIVPITINNITTSYELATDAAITVRLSSYNGIPGFADTSMPRKLVWPNEPGQSGVTLSNSTNSGATGAAPDTGARYIAASSPARATGLTRANLSLVKASEIGGKPVRLIGYYCRKKGITGTAGKYINSDSFLPMFMGNTGYFNLIDDGLSANWDEVYVPNNWDSYPPAVGDEEIKTAASGTYLTTSWGNSSTGVDSTTGSRIVLRDIPAQPLVSLGQFMHLPIAYHQTAGANRFLTFGSMFMGGSLASPHIPTDKTALTFLVTGQSGSSLHLDHSFLANQALFDKYYFSTVPPKNLANTTPSTTYPKLWQDFNGANTGDRLTDSAKPLPNSRMKPYARDGTQPLMADLRDMDKAAANLLLDGAFNVNSTSVNAWRALLSSLSGNALQVWNASAGDLATFSTGTINPIPRFWSASFNGQMNRPWEGMRALDDNEITDLAGKIVRQVKTRGPFLSMADFLNRRIGSSSPLTLKGALQAAIDDIETVTAPNSVSKNINVIAKAAGMNVSTGSTTTTEAFWRTADMIKENLPDNTACGIPGYLMQQDLVQAFSPVMTVRSDTFIVRCYGEALNPSTSKIEGQAWGEAVVQRLPEFIKHKASPSQNDGDYPENSLSSLKEDVNKNLGRRFKVISFRWLNKNDL